MIGFMPLCEVCGGPIRPDNRYGVCQRNPACRRENQRRQYAAHQRDRDRTWISWYEMVRRCYIPGARGWDDYGGADPPVTVCERWLVPDGVGFKNFLADLGERPIDGPASARTGRTVWQSLGRYRDQGHYAPDSSEWMTAERRARTRGPRSGTSSRFKGVRWNNGRWQATIIIDGECYHLGCFTGEEDAAAAYDAAAREAWGEDCWLNFPE